MPDTQFSGYIQDQTNPALIRRRHSQVIKLGSITQGVFDDGWGVFVTPRQFTPQGLSLNLQIKGHRDAIGLIEFDGLGNAVDD